MTARPIDTEREALWHRVSGVLRGHAFVQHGRGYGEHIDLSAQAADYFADRIDPIIMDALAAAEHRIARLEAQSDIRGRAVVMYRERARDAEARIKAVRDVHTGTVWPGVADKPICDACDQMWPCATIRALDGTDTPPDAG